jgi:hypothetical protein
MMHLRTNLAEPVGTNLREVVATIARRHPALPGPLTPEEVKTVLDNLTASMETSVNQVAPGRKRSYRACPKRGHLNLRKTTLCRDCWSNVMEIGSLAPGESQR